jgi:hypothetical protein
MGTVFIGIYLDGNIFNLEPDLEWLVNYPALKYDLPLTILPDRLAFLLTMYKHFSLNLIVLGPIVLDFSYISEELTDKSKCKPDLLNNLNFHLAIYLYFRITRFIQI